MSVYGHNRLPGLLSEIQIEHAAVKASVASVVEHARAAGAKLLQVKAITGSGQWLETVRGLWHLCAYRANLHPVISTHIKLPVLTGWNAFYLCREPSDGAPMVGAGEPYWSVNQLLDVLDFLYAVLPSWHIVFVVSELAKSGRIRAYGRRCDEASQPGEAFEAILPAEWAGLELDPPPYFKPHPGDLWRRGVGDRQRRRLTGQRAWADVLLSLNDLTREWLGTIFATRRYALPAGISIPPDLPPAPASARPPAGIHYIHEPASPPQSPVAVWEVPGQRSAGQGKGPVPDPVKQQRLELLRKDIKPNVKPGESKRGAIRRLLEAKVRKELPAHSANTSEKTRIDELIRLWDDA